MREDLDVKSDIEQDMIEEGQREHWHRDIGDVGRYAASLDESVKAKARKLTSLPVCRKPPRAEKIHGYFDFQQLRRSQNTVISYYST